MSGTGGAVGFVSTGNVPADARGRWGCRSQRARVTYLRMCWARGAVGVDEHRRLAAVGGTVGALLLQARARVEAGVGRALHQRLVASAR